MAATPAAIARAAGLDPKTVRSLIDGEHWPSDYTQSRVEAALRWSEGEIVRRAVRGGIDGALDALTDVELATELLRRLNDRERRDKQLRGNGARHRAHPEPTSAMTGRSS